jgi:uncharacterized damage-inducible protein DinB
MRDYLLKLFDHERWAMEQLMNALEGYPILPERAATLLGHMHVAHDFWFRRMRQLDVEGFNWWPRLSTAECRKLNAEHAEKWQAIINNLSEPLDSHTLTVKRRTGADVTLRVIDALTQLHSHSVHHRAQINMDLRNSGLEPVNTDYLVYCLKHGSKEK